jgi:hypothetical protein
MKAHAENQKITFKAEFNDMLAEVLRMVEETENED